MVAVLLDEPGHRTMGSGSERHQHKNLAGASGKNARYGQNPSTMRWRDQREANAREKADPDPWTKRAANQIVAEARGHAVASEVAPAAASHLLRCGGPARLHPQSRRCAQRGVLGL